MAATPTKDERSADAAAPMDLAAFHAGDREAIAQCYHENFGRALAAAARVVGAVDAETVTHEVFHRLLASAEMRARFTGGDIGAWLARVATNQALGHRRRYAREAALPPGLAISASDAGEALSAQLVIERFRRDCLPAKWARVFETRFLGQLGQREAARELGMNRTTLMYQEHRIRALLRRFVREDER